MTNKAESRTIAEMTDRELYAEICAANPDGTVEFDDDGIEYDAIDLLAELPANFRWQITRSMPQRDGRDFVCSIMTYDPLSRTEALGNSLPRAICEAWLMAYRSGWFGHFANSPEIPESSEESNCE